MKKWRLRILSALLTFTLSLCAVAIVRFRLAPVARVQPVYEGTNITEQLPPPQIAEETQLAEEVMQPHPVSISPYEIKRILEEEDLSTCERGRYSGYFDFEPIWRKLGLKISDESDAFPEKCDSLAKASIYTIELDGKSGKETLLKLDFGTPYATLYLIFKHTGNQRDAGWKLLGSLPYYYGAPFCPPSHKVITAGQHRWLVIDYSTGHGSGFGSSADDWYEVRERGVTPVLSYQTGLFAMAWETSPSIERRTKVLKTDFSNGIATVVLQTTTSYKSWKEDDLLWTNQRQATFVKWPGVQKFSFDPLHSEIIEKELNPYFGDDANITGREFLKYNYRDLARIAARGTAKQKEWLRDYLDACDESLEKQSLQTALGDSQP